MYKIAIIGNSSRRKILIEALTKINEEIEIICEQNINVEDLNLIIVNVDDNKKNLLDKDNLLNDSHNYIKTNKNYNNEKVYSPKYFSNSKVKVKTKEVPHGRKRKMHMR